MLALPCTPMPSCAGELSWIGIVLSISGDDVEGRVSRPEVLVCLPQTA
jgi:hypothetical protein